MLEFRFSLPITPGKEPRRIEDKSYYDHNYYELYEYGDWVLFGRDYNNILYEEYDEAYNSYTYEFGRFEDGKFVSVLGFTTSKPIL